MRIDLSVIDREQFIVQEHLIAGEVCTLVTPQHIGTKWDESNLHWRSSLWNSQGELISASWRKHHNWLEQPDLRPAPSNLDEMTLVEKIDGSTLLISKYRDTLICRTRGTVDATRMANGHEIETFKKRYPKLFEMADERFTIVTEWVSPENVIVISYPEADLYLTGVIWHHDYSYTEQNHLDRIAEMVGVKRPRYYSFASVEQMLKEVDGFKGVEGVCAYYPLHGIRDNCFRKSKGSVYLSLHRFKERVSLPNLLDLWTELSRPDLATFQGALERDFDHECRLMADPMAVQICAADNVVVNNVAKIKDDLTTNFLDLPSRRDQALAIQLAYTDLYRGVAFKLLDNREIDDKMWRKLIEAELGL